MEHIICCIWYVLFLKEWDHFSGWPFFINRFCRKYLRRWKFRNYRMNFRMNFKSNEFSFWVFDETNFRPINSTKKIGCGVEPQISTPVLRGFPSLVHEHDALIGVSLDSRINKFMTCESICSCKCSLQQKLNSLIFKVSIYFTAIKMLFFVYDNLRKFFQLRRFGGQPSRQKIKILQWVAETPT